MCSVTKHQIDVLRVFLFIYLHVMLDSQNNGTVLSFELAVKKICHLIFSDLSCL